MFSRPECSRKDVADFHITGSSLKIYHQNPDIARIMHQNNASKSKVVFPPVGQAAFHSVDTLFSMTKLNVKLRISA